MKKYKKVLITVSVMLYVTLSTISTFASETHFTNVLVDSNSYSHVCYASKNESGTVGALKITDIYKADGTTSNYSYVYAKATNSGTAQLVKKGTWVDLTIPSGFTSAGSYVSLRCKGANPALDCRISGYWNVH